jgi:hypothetical protein
MCIPGDGHLVFPDLLPITASPQTATLAMFQANPANPLVREQPFDTSGFGATANCQPPVPAQFDPDVSPDAPTWLAPPLF